MGKSCRIYKFGGKRTYCCGGAIFQARLLPFIPSGIVTFSSAMSNVSIRVFILATACGKIPSILLEVLVSYNLVNRKYAQFWLTAAALLVLLLMVKKHISNLKN